MSDVQPGNIYRDKDPRMDGRHLKVFEVDSRFAYCVGCAPDGRVTGKRSRVSLKGLAERFEKVGGSSQREDLERTALETLKAWRDAKHEFTRLHDSASSLYPEGWMQALWRAGELEAELLAAADALSEGGEG